MFVPNLSSLSSVSCSNLFTTNSSSTSTSSSSTDFQPSIHEEGKETTIERVTRVGNWLIEYSDYTIFIDDSNKVNKEKEGMIAEYIGIPLENIEFTHEVNYCRATIKNCVVDNIKQHSQSLGVPVYVLGYKQRISIPVQALAKDIIIRVIDEEKSLNSDGIKYLPDQVGLSRMVSGRTTEILSADDKLPKEELAFVSLRTGRILAKLRPI